MWWGGGIKGEWRRHPTQVRRLQERVQFRFKRRESRGRNHRQRRRRDDVRLEQKRAHPPTGTTRVMSRRMTEPGPCTTFFKPRHTRPLFCGKKGLPYRNFAFPLDSSSSLNFLHVNRFETRREGDGGKKENFLKEVVDVEFFYSDRVSSSV